MITFPFLYDSSIFWCSLIGLSFHFLNFLCTNNQFIPKFSKELKTSEYTYISVRYQFYVLLGDTSPKTLCPAPVYTLKEKPGSQFLGSWVWKRDWNFYCSICRVSLIDPVFSIEASILSSAGPECRTWGVKPLQKVNLQSSARMGMAEAAVWEDKMGEGSVAGVQLLALKTFHQAACFSISLYCSAWRSI